MKISLDLHKVKEWLPHRDPFLFVDSIEEIYFPKEDKKLIKFDCKDYIGGRVLGTYKTKKDHTIFEGHFPGNPILPGVIQIEIMAQVASFLVYADKASDRRLNVALLGINSSKFRNPILPEMELKVEVNCTNVRRDFYEFDCKLTHENKLMCEASVRALVKV